FFFSSRRRHTRSDRDWSSDVCSSDLSGLARDVQPESAPPDAAAELRIDAVELSEDPLLLGGRDPDPLVADGDPDAAGKRLDLDRSEERRVGKECSALREMSC